MKLLSLFDKLRAMDINAVRLQIIKELQQVNDISLLQAVKHLVHYGLKNEGHISIEQYNRELEEAEEEIERGEYITQEELKKRMKEW
jgi:hypothetical protein